MSLKLSSVEYIDEYGRLCVVQFWNFVEAARFAAQQQFLINLTYGAKP